MPKNSIAHSTKGGWFLIFGYHIQNCRSSEKVVRKEITLRFFFPLDLARKKNRGIKSRDFIPTVCGFFQVLGFISNLVDGFFFPDKNPEGKKTVKSSARKEGRGTHVITKKKHTPLPQP